MDAVQQGASQVVCQVLGGRNLNQALGAFLQAAPALAPQQRAALQDLSYGTLRFYGQLLRVLEQLLHKPVQDTQLRCLLLVALYQLQYSKAAPHAVVDHAVCAGRKRNAAASGLVNAVLRNFLRNRNALLAVAAGSEEGRYSYPQWWIDAVKAQYGEQAEAILLAGNRHPPMTLRVNRRRTAPADYLALLAQQGIRASVVEPDAVLLQHPMAVDKLPGFSDGLVSVQDAGAQYAAHLLDVHDGMRVLDACAAPGGKSAHLLELAQLDLLALDKDAQRLDQVRENMQRLQLHARLQVGDAAQPAGWWDGRLFQRILADAPCSASGVVRRHPDIKWLRRPEDMDGFAQQQAQILSALWRLLARDGKLLYATCSIFARENREVITEFLRQHDDARSVPLPAPGLGEGQLLPDGQHDGFFYALLHKQMTEDRKASVAPSHPHRAARSCLGNCKRSIIAVLCILFSVLCPLSSVFGEGIAMHRAEAHFSDGSYQLSADFDISFNFVVEQALTRGVPLYFINEFVLTRPRWYWMDEVVAQSEQTIKLSYNSLSRQYRIARGALFQNFASLDDALRIIAHQSAAPIPAELLNAGGGYISEKLLRKDGNYVAAVRLHLDVTQLPKPLQVNALTGDDWNLDSDWYRWIVRPDAAARNRGG